MSQKIKGTEGLHIISALTHRQIVELLECKIITAELFDEKQIVEVFDRLIPKIPSGATTACVATPRLPGAKELRIAWFLVKKGQARPGGGIGLLISPTGSSLPN